MGRLRKAAVVLASGIAILGLVGGSAGAQTSEPKLANGEVEVFILDKLVPVKKFQNPDGCYQLPAGTHVVINDTDSNITLYAGSDCGGSLPSPGISLDPGYGAHELPAFGSFEA